MIIVRPIRSFIVTNNCQAAASDRLTLFEMRRLKNTVDIAVSRTNRYSLNYIVPSSSVYGALSPRNTGWTDHKYLRTTLGNVFKTNRVRTYVISDVISSSFSIFRSSSYVDSKICNHPWYGPVKWVQVTLLRRMNWSKSNLENLQYLIETQCRKLSPKLEIKLINRISCFSVLSVFFSVIF